MLNMLQICKRDCASTTKTCQTLHRKRRSKQTIASNWIIQNIWTRAKASGSGTESDGSWEKFVSTAKRSCEKSTRNKNHEKIQTFVRCCQMPTNRQNVLIKSRGKMRTLIGISLLNKSTCRSSRFACILLTSISAASTLRYFIYSVVSISASLNRILSFSLSRSVFSTRFFTTLLFELSRFSLAWTHYTDFFAPALSLSLSQSCDDKDKRIPFIFMHVYILEIAVHFLGNNLCVPSCGAEFIVHFAHVIK